MRAREAIACSGNSSSVPQLVQSASWSITTRPQVGHWRRSSRFSEREKTAASRPKNGTAAEIKNHSQYEEPLAFPTRPPKMPKATAIPR